MDTDGTARDEATRAATVSLENAQAQIERLLSVGVGVSSDQDLIEVGYRIQLAADAVNGMLELRGYGPESRG